MDDATFSGVLCFANFDAALPLLRNKTRLFELCCASPDGILEMLIGELSYKLDKKAMVAIEKMCLEEQFRKSF